VICHADLHPFNLLVGPDRAVTVLDWSALEAIRRVLSPGGRLQFADIANGRPVPPEALRDIDLWTG
jgi:predicted unusual protein kinase regulating ubiquinone biosynthesis (AarF/ABC1/UbiB family)